ncbi:hypothetical protein Ato02nite_090990 [Paractinoplanes toevensis]|uniref:Uncharacterized protein n=1 Tax=Paractinoplanes toevensis TaxID=571911 RepID=A0A920BR53_9ACTN|nr:hypothetical protein Ato02nite_090990 [Actinoplanes toevensis]
MSFDEKSRRCTAALTAGKSSRHVIVRAERCRLIRQTPGSPIRAAGRKRPAAALPSQQPQTLRNSYQTERIAEAVSAMSTVTRRPA